jgi:hypothetical protein
MANIPSLVDVLEILTGITQITADISATDLSCPEFLVTLKFSRAELRRAGAYKFANEDPVPTWLFSQIISFLQQLQTRNDHERQWAREIGSGATLTDCIAFLNGQILREKGSVAATVTRSLYERTVKHLKELEKRRVLGGYHNPYEDRQSQDSAKWRFEDSLAAEELRKQQERQRRQQQYQQTYEQARAANSGFNEAFRRAFDSGAFDSFFTDGRQWGNPFTFRDQSPPPPPPNTATGKRWFEVLGVPISASRKDIKIATRKLRAQYHPDRYKGADAHERISAINVACDEGLAGAST